MKFSVIAFLLFTTVIAQAQIAPGQATTAQVAGDQVAFQKAMQAPTDSARIAELDRFIDENPHSTLVASAHAMRYQSYMQMQKDTAAYFAIRSYLSAIDASQIVPALNAVAMEFAQRNFFIDSAAVMIDTAIARYGKTEPVLLNTKALLLFRLKRYAAAESVQNRVIAAFPPDTRMDARYVPFYIQLGFIEMETGKGLTGLSRIILGNIVLPKQSLPLNRMDSLMAEKHLGGPAVRDSLYRTAVSEFLAASTDSVMAKSLVAVALARIGIFPDLSLSLAASSYDAVASRTIEERSGAAAARGLVNFLLDRPSEAERYLSEAAVFASPNETEIFLSLGNVKERLGKKKEAFETYLTCAMGTRATSVYQKLIELKNELYPSVSLDSLIVAQQAAVLRYRPEEFQRPAQSYGPNEYPRVVLAELFTGSECKPCAAADAAFDYLIDRYRTSSLAILEYHQHIPAPDPMANASTDERAEYYGVNSTPTAVFGGTTAITSGGSRMMGKNKFLLYSDVIERQMVKPSPAALSVTATLRNNSVAVRVKGSVTGATPRTMVRIALAEEEVLYKGANGVEHHRFVVRTMVGGVNGTAVAKNGKIAVDKSVDLKKLSADLERYHATRTEEFSRLGASFKEKRTTIDPHRLAVVVFLQDDSTREVLQAVTEKVNVSATKK